MENVGNMWQEIKGEKMKQNNLTKRQAIVFTGLLVGTLFIGFVFVVLTR